MQPGIWCNISNISLAGQLILRSESNNLFCIFKKFSSWATYSLWTAEKSCSCKGEDQHGYNRVQNWIASEELSFPLVTANKFFVGIGPVEARVDLKGTERQVNRVYLTKLHAFGAYKYLWLLFTRLKLPFWVKRRPCEWIQDSLGFWILCHGFRISGTGFRISCHWNLYSGIQCPGFQILQVEICWDSGFHKQNFHGFRISDFLTRGEAWEVFEEWEAFKTRFILRAIRYL